MAGFFKCPNALIDELCKVLTPAEFVCLSIVIRKTKGWHKGSDPIALSQFQQLAGIRSHKTILKALDFLAHPDINLLEASRQRGRCSVYKLGDLFEKLSTDPGKNYRSELAKFTEVRRYILPRLPGKTTVKITDTKESIKTIKEAVIKPGEKRTKDTNFLSPPISLREYKENALAGEVKCPLARDNQRLLAAASEYQLEPDSDELEEDFKKRLNIVQLLSSLTRGLKREM